MKQVTKGESTERRMHRKMEGITGVITLTGRRGDRYRGLPQAARVDITAHVLHGVRLHIQIAENLSADTSDANVPDIPVAGGAVDDHRPQSRSRSKVCTDFPKLGDLTRREVSRRTLTQYPVRCAMYRCAVDEF